MSNYNIFISYRRKDGFDTAKLIYDKLKMDGYSVSFDVETLENGKFDKEIERRIQKCKDFVLLLSPGVFERFQDDDYNSKDDFVRMEISTALKANRNIIPLKLDNFIYPKRLPNDIKDIARINNVEFNHAHFEAAYEKLKRNFLRSKPVWKVRFRKMLMSFAALTVFSFIAFLFYLVCNHYEYKLKEARSRIQAAETRAEEVMSMIASKEGELKQKEIIKDTEIEIIIDSTNMAKRAEIDSLVDSMDIAYKVEMDRMIDSINKANKRVMDSINKARRAEVTRVTDSIKLYMSKRGQASAKTPVKKTAVKTSGATTQQPAVKKQTTSAKAKGTK